MGGLPTGWHVAHLLALGVWAGLVAAELMIEVGGARQPALRGAVARLHHLIDVYVEAPVLVAVVGTGTVLLTRTAPDALLWTKVALGLGAVGANAACVVVVVRRGRAAAAGAADETVAPLTRWVFRSAFVGVPLGLAALLLGGGRVGWW